VELEDALELIFEVALVDVHAARNTVVNVPVGAWAAREAPLEIDALSQRVATAIGRVRRRQTTFVHIDAA